MAAIVSSFKGIIYERNYLNDVEPQVTLAKRVALAVVPFLSLHPSLRAPISIVMGALRVQNFSRREDVLGTTVAVAALAATFFRNPAALVLTAGYDIFIEIQNLRTTENWEEAIQSLIKILNNAIFLALVMRGGAEVALLTFILQAVVNLIQSKDEFKKGRWIEGVSNLLLCGIRLHQFQAQYRRLQRNWEIEAAIKRIPVGKLHEKWKFPSDHLPVGIEVNGIKGISWNVLNTAFMEWVTTKDSQGLNGSMISELNVVVDASGLTQRDVAIAQMVQSIMDQGQVIALQECSTPFLNYLQEQLPSNWELVKSFNTPRRDQDVILYNKSQLTYQSALSETTCAAYPSDPGRALQMAYFFNKEGLDIRIVNAHIPGDPHKPGRVEFARYVHKQHTNDSITIALGDNNFEREEMLNAYQEAGFSEFSLHSPWKTNIDPDSKESKAIDHFFVIGDHESRDLRPSEVLVGENLQESIDLLNSAVF